MTKKILRVGFDLASDEVEYQEFDSKASLLDWDIILFSPSISRIAYSGYEDSEYQGKLCLSDTKSFRLKDACAHWRHQIKDAVDCGRTVFVFLTEVVEVFVATGTKNTSGTGRNQKVTRHVELFSNYKSIPISDVPVSATGSRMKLAEPYKDAFQDYWNEFEQYSEYKSTFPKSLKNASIVTTTGERPVSLVFRNQASNGSLILLPSIDFQNERFIEDDDEGWDWSSEGRQFASRLIKSLVQLDSSIRKGLERSPEPDWANHESYATQLEHRLKQELLLAQESVERAIAAKEKVESELQSAGELRALLYEKGRPLEQAIIAALRILGFHAEQFQDENSEFDAVFKCSDGRLIGEAEGKDTKAVNIDKLRQLSMNIHEDLQRDEVLVPAKGILFGNGYRFTAPELRSETFTAKCKLSATTTNIGLVSTTDLFGIVRYLRENRNDSFASACRRVMLESNGVIVFPEVPADYEENRGPLEKN